MAKGPSYRVAYRRRREHKTDYKARRLLATTDVPRLVIRPSSSNILIQLVRSEIEGDYVLAHASSSELVKRFSWRGGRANTTAAYLLGFILGSKALKQNVESAVLDIGLRSPTKGSKIFAVVRGAKDAGFEIPCDDEIMPGSNRIEGAHIASYAKGLKESPEGYERRFSNYLKRGLNPEELSSYFAEFKSKIKEELGA